jgi:hypothetical protein
MIRRESSPIPQAIGITAEPTKARPAQHYAWLLLWALIPLALWWSLREVSFPAILDTLSSLRLGSILVLAALNVLIFLLFSSRWWLILRTQGHSQPYLALSGYRLAAFGVTYFTPGTQLGGEPLQVYLLQRRGGIPTATAVASVALEKLLELVANFTFLLVGVTTILATGILGDRLSIGLLLLPIGLLVLPVGYLVPLWRGAHPISWVVERLARRFPGSIRLNQASQTASAAEREVARFCREHPRTLLLASSFSLVIWVLKVFEFGLTLQFLGLPLALPEVITALTAARLAYLMPFPAGLGSLEASQVLAMGLIGVTPAAGIALSLVIRARDVLLGVSGLWLGGVLARR